MPRPKQIEALHVVVGVFLIAIVHVVDTSRPVLGRHRQIYTPFLHSQLHHETVIRVRALNASGEAPSGFGAAPALSAHRRGGQPLVHVSVVSLAVQCSRSSAPQ